MKAHGKSTESGSVKSIAAVVAYRHCFAFDGFNYTNKKGFVGAFLMVPENQITEILKSKQMDRFPADIQAEIKAKLEAGDVRNMWRSSAKHEKRKDAQYCMEMEVSLQHELTLEENLKNLRTLLDNHYIKKGLCADVAIHDSGNNLHAHVLITQRQLVKLNVDIVNNMDIQYTFSDKKLRDDTFGSRPSDKQLLPIREEWANLCNVSFEAAGLDVRVSHETLEVQKEKALEVGDFLKAAELDRQPVKHIHRGFIEQAEREAEAEKAEYHNEREAKHYENQLELVKAGILDEDLIFVPEFKPVIKTFADKLKQRTLERARIIKENAERYFKDRTDRYSRLFRKARSRAEEIIETTKSVARSARYKARLEKAIRMDNQELVNGNELARSIIETLDSLNAEQQRSIEIDRRVSQSHQAELIAKSSIDLSKKLESKVDEKMKPKLWFDPYQRPEFKPSWAK